MLEGITGFTASRDLPEWSGRPFRDSEAATSEAPDIVLLADTFNRYFEPENLRAAKRVLDAAGIKAAVATPDAGGRPLCCGRTFLSAGLVDKAREEAQNLVRALLPHARAGRPIVGLEPSCLLALRDEVPGLLPGPDAEVVAKAAVLFEELIADRAERGELSLPLRAPAPRLLLHGHCHQKAFGVMSAVERTLKLLPDTEIEAVETSCCGMAGSFGYGADTHAVSLKMGELDLLPAVRARAPDTIVVADGTSCRHQIRDGAGADAVHVAVVLDKALRKGMH